jgi:hypothetical protein
MPKPGVTFAWLRQYLIDLGFEEVVVPRSHVRFHHGKSGAEVILPVYRPNQLVIPPHLLPVRVMLDAKGLVDGGRFEEIVASASAERSAS